MENLSPELSVRVNDVFAYHLRPADATTPLARPHSSPFSFSDSIHWALQVTQFPVDPLLLNGSRPKVDGEVR
jgi:hypothetical protein